MRPPPLTEMPRAEDRPVAIRVAMYHAVVASPLRVPDWCCLDVERFAAQMAHLSANYEIVPLETVPRRLGEPGRGRPSIAITFDDGFLNNWEVAWPVLREARIPATIFLVTGLIGTSDTLWWCRLHHAIEDTNVTALEWNEVRYDMTSTTARANASKALQAAMKGLSRDRLRLELGAIAAALGVDIETPLSRSSPFHMLDWSAVAEMTGSGLIDVGAHTDSHAILSLLTPEEQRREIDQSISRIEEVTGRPCRLFAYPNGRRGDYDAATLELVGRLGVHACVTTEEGHNDITTDPLQLRRYGIGNDWDFTHFLEGL